jgi:hypothetical protein
VYTIEAAHNPEVAGSNPAPATDKALLSGAFCLLIGRGAADFVPLFVPIAKVRRREALRFRASTLSLQANSYTTFHGDARVSSRVDEPYLLDEEPRPQLQHLVELPGNLQSRR